MTHDDASGLTACVTCGRPADTGPRLIAMEQAEDEGLWFAAQTAPEAYLQQELRRLHAAIEAAPPAPSREAMRAALKALEESRDDVNEVMRGYLHGEGHASYDRRIKQYREQLARHDAAIALLRAALGGGE